MRGGKRHQRISGGDAIADAASDASREHGAALLDPSDGNTCRTTGSENENRRIKNAVHNAAGKKQKIAMFHLQTLKHANARDGKNAKALCKNLWRLMCDRVHEDAQPCEADEGRWSQDRLKCEPGIGFKSLRH